MLKKTMQLFRMLRECFVMSIHNILGSRMRSFLTILGILIGVLMTPFFIGIIEPPDCTYIRSTHWNAWLIAFIVEGIFTIIINGSVFRRVHKLNFHEIM